MSFSWSPDGTQIAYQTGDSHHGLYLLDLATGEQRELTRPFGAIHGIGPVWSPDGESIVYQRQLGSGETHEVVLIWPGELTDDGIAREEVVPLFDHRKTGNDRELLPRWVTWSPDGEYLLFGAWPRSGGFNLLGVTSSTPGSPADILVPGLYPGEDPNDPALVYFEPFFVEIQPWGRLPTD
jgi:Tol biopolymer transport system component